MNWFHEVHIIILPIYEHISCTKDVNIEKVSSLSFHVTILNHR